MGYRNEIVKAMKLLSSHKGVIFLGQGTRYSGHAMFGTLEDAEVPMNKRIEMPVAEDMQMGISIGLSLQGYIPVSIYPRMDFLIIAMNQLVNHLDKMKEMTHGEYSPKVIIRTAIGSKTPLDGGIQHTNDYTLALRRILNNVDVWKLHEAGSIVPLYKYALESDRSTILIEMADLYNEKGRD